MEFDLAGHLRLTLRSTDPLLARAVAAEMDPYLPIADEEGVAGPSIVLELLSPGDGSPVEMQLASGDGYVTQSTPETLFVLSDHLRASVPDAVNDELPRVRFDPGYPVRHLFRHVVRPALQLRALAAGSVAIHAAAVEWNGRAVLVAGWSESGKTEAALALAEDGARFVTDKWTLVASGPDDAGSMPTAAPFPIAVGVRRWVLRYLPELRRGLPRRARVQFAAARMASLTRHPMRLVGRRGMRGMLAEGAERAVALADRAALTPTEVAAVYGHPPLRARLPIGLVAILRTVPGREVSVRRGEIATLARRLASSALTERQGYFALRQRAAFAFGDASDSAAVVAAETRRLMELMAETVLVEVSAPFPTDPRRVAEALQSWLPSTR